MEIRTALPADTLAIADIHVAGWQSAYRGLVPDDHLDRLSVSKRREQWVKAVECGRPKILVAEIDDAVVGWIPFDQCRDADKPSGTGEIWAIYVAPDRLGQGVGRELWLRALAGLRHHGFLHVTLWVLSLNHRACGFYAKAGFRPELESAKTVDIGGAQLQELRYSRGIAA